jgi:hypothetical protein
MISGPTALLASKVEIISKIDWLIPKKTSPLTPLSQMNLSVHLAKLFRRRFLKIGQSETRIACGGHVC